MRYFRFQWNETTGDELDAWGTSTWFVQADESLDPIRQLMKFENGNVLKYDSDHIGDDFGMLGDQSIPPDVPDVIEISKEQFWDIWDSTDAVNRR